MDFKKSIQGGTFYGFVPHRLAGEKLELWHFPFNVLFVSFAVVDGVRTMGSAIYLPDVSTLAHDGGRHSMRYLNAYGGDSYLVIVYDEIEEKYTGEKFVNGSRVGMAFGNQWNMFFVHLTALGLSNGEACVFDPVKTND